MNEPQGKPRSQFRVLIVYPNLPLMLTPAIAIGLFTRIFRDMGYQVELFETTHYIQDQLSSSLNRVKMLNVRSFKAEDDLGVQVKHTDMFDDFRACVDRFEPDLMIFSVVEDAFLQAIDLLRVVADRRIPHILGGVFPTTAPERCFEFPEVNMIGRGEGERTVVEVAEAVRNNLPLSNITGTWYRGEDGKIIRHAVQPLVDINAVTPDFGLFDDNRFYRPMGGRIFKVIPVETYRGCPYLCTYCNSPGQRLFAKENQLGEFLRRKTIANLRKELTEYMDRFNPEFFFFVDDSFLARPRQEIFDFCDMYEEFKLPFWFNTRAENCTKEVMTRLAEVGCYRISFGLEAGNEQYRSEVLKRKVTNVKYIEHFKIIRDSGIAFSLNVIIGMPGETRDLVMDTVEMVRSIEGYDALTVSIFTPYHGTVLRDVAVKNGWFDPKTFTKHTTSSSLLRMPPPYLSVEEIDGLAAVFPLYCYFPEDDWPQIRRAETPDEEGLRIRDHYAERYSSEFLGETQDVRRSITIDGGTGCRSNPKESFRISPKRLSDEELLLLASH